MKELIGQRLSKYEIEAQIGRGGMATVFKAKDATLDRYVAIKVLPPEYAAEMPGFVARFEREAQAIAQLEHPNILPVYDYGQQGPYTYLVMRYIEGSRTLAEAMRDSLTAEESLAYLRQIANALDYAHKRGIIHRDIKPGNILLAGDWAFLADFGLARLVEATVQLTRTGTGLGTPAYMSPEQGIGSPVDHRTDLYAVGVIAYQMFTGQIPHHAPTPHAIIYKRNHEPPASIRLFNADLSPVLDQAIQKALARDPDQRFQTTGELVTSLEQAIHHHQTDRPTMLEFNTRAGQPATGANSPPASKWPYLAVASAVVMLLAVAGLTVFWLIPSSVPEQINSITPVNQVVSLDTNLDVTPEVVPPTPTHLPTATPDHLKSMYQSAQDLIAAGNPDEALVLLRQIAQENPDYADVALLIRELSPTATPTKTRPSTSTPTPTPPPTHTPRPTRPPTPTIPQDAGMIILQGSSDDAGFNSYVQWVDGANQWHNVDNWQGRLDDQGRISWLVWPKDFGSGPFRWLVYDHNGTVIFQSQLFYLPGAGQDHRENF